MNINQTPGDLTIELARIFHTHRDEEAAKADEARRTKDFDAGLYV